MKGRKMSRINSMSPSFGIKKANAANNKTMSNLRNLNPDNLKFEIQLPNDKIELNIPYKKLDEEGKEETQNLISLFSQLQNRKKNYSPEEEATIIEKIATITEKLVSSFQRANSKE